MCIYMCVYIYIPWGKHEGSNERFQQIRICTKSLWTCLADLSLVLRTQGAILI